MYRLSEFLKNKNNLNTVSSNSCYSVELQSMAAYALTLSYRVAPPSFWSLVIASIRPNGQVDGFNFC